MSDEPLDWSALLQAVRTDYPTLYRAWFESLEPGRLIGGELRVSVADPAWLHYLREHCAQVFSHTAMELTGHLVSVRFESGEESVLDDPVRQQRQLRRLPLNPDYTFAEFVVGPSNRLAHAAGLAVCSQPGVLYNPLFIHGASGLGKSHLLQAICAELLRSSPDANVIYVACDTFVSEYVSAIEAGDLHTFRNSVRQADALLIDDVQFLANRESSQEELFHTFNALYQERRQIVLSLTRRRQIYLTSKTASLAASTGASSRKSIHPRAKPGRQSSRKRPGYAATKYPRTSSTTWRSTSIPTFARWKER